MSIGPKNDEQKFNIKSLSGYKFQSPLYYIFYFMLVVYIIGLIFNYQFNPTFIDILIGLCLIEALRFFLGQKKLWMKSIELLETVLKK